MAGPDLLCLFVHHVDEFPMGPGHGFRENAGSRSHREAGAVRKRRAVGKGDAGYRYQKGS